MAPIESWLRPSELRPKPDWLRSMFPWPQQALVVNGRTMAYLDEGPRDGQIVLWLSVLDT